MKKIIVAICMILLCMPNLVYASSNTVTIAESTYSYYKDGQPAGYNKHAIFTSSTGNPVYCGNHGLPTSVGDNIGDSKTLEMHDYDNEMVSKVLYYGYLGPKEWEGFDDPKYNGVYKAYTLKDKRKWCGNAVTGMALTKTQGKGYFYNISGFEEFWEYISTAPSPTKGFKTYIMYGNNNEQNLFTWSYNPVGTLELKKITENNSYVIDECPNLYSLKGAEYLVSSDFEFNNVVGKLITDENGVTNSLELKPGSYYVKEIKAPKGFKIDETTHVVLVEEDKINTLNALEEPLVNKMDLILLKEDSNTNKGLEGAVFSVNYYNELAKDLRGLEPKRTWFFKTDKDGKIVLDDKYKVDGDELYKDSNGNAIGLIGTYEIKEVAPPKGYARSTETVIRQVTGDEFSKDTLYDPPTVANKKQMVSIILQKCAKITGDGGVEVQNEIYLEGAVYQVLDSNDNVIGEITTEKNGTGSLMDISPGIYRLKEIKAPEGYLLNPEEIVVDCQIEDDVVSYREYYVVAEDLPIPPPPEPELPEPETPEPEIPKPEKPEPQIPIPLTKDMHGDSIMLWGVVIIIGALSTYKIHKKTSKK